MKKTNATRLLDAAKIPYETAPYDEGADESVAIAAAKSVGAAPETVFKTLAATGEKTGAAVFCLPADATLNMKAAAKALGEKRVALLPPKDLLATTGYVRGGCSPLGMKRALPTFVDASALEREEIYLNAGAKGLLMKLDPKRLAEVIEVEFLSLT
jgi:Cys-tRNA(Pro)/Cys-tRNA(Cys) deacylase